MLEIDFVPLNDDLRAERLGEMGNGSWATYYNEQAGYAIAVHALWDGRRTDIHKVRDIWLPQATAHKEIILRTNKSNLIDVVLPWGHTEVPAIKQGVVGHIAVRDFFFKADNKRV